MTPKKVSKKTAKKLKSKLQSDKKSDIFKEKKSLRNSTKKSIKKKTKNSIKKLKNSNKKTEGVVKRPDSEGILISEKGSGDIKRAEQIIPIEGKHISRLEELLIKGEKEKILELVRKKIKQLEIKIENLEEKEEQWKDTSYSLAQSFAERSHLTLAEVLKQFNAPEKEDEAENNNY